ATKLAAVLRIKCEDDLFLFFFSSRRRHTRFKCDWSSDVCSSDLICRSVAAGSTRGGTGTDVGGGPGALGGVRSGTPSTRADRGRSEERRVGKEWRWGGGGEQWRKGSETDECNDVDVKRETRTRSE